MLLGNAVVAAEQLLLLLPHLHHDWLWKCFSAQLSPVSHAAALHLHRISGHLTVDRPDLREAHLCLHARKTVS